MFQVTILTFRNGLEGGAGEMGEVGCCDCLGEVKAGPGKRAWRRAATLP